VDDVVIRDAREDELDIVASLVVDAYAEYAATMAPDASSSPSAATDWWAR
jgi:hypothetical protein